MKYECIRCGKQYAKDEKPAVCQCGNDKFDAAYLYEVEFGNGKKINLGVVTTNPHNTLLSLIKSYKDEGEDNVKVRLIDPDVDVKATKDVAVENIKNKAKEILDLYGLDDYYVTVKIAKKPKNKTDNNIEGDANG